ncbi:hypothetical protein [Enhygromyxa salina]|uniref:Glycosyltransferase RgtA/B/C/D-like domain-containing protein n=1 Tax=Enhygromyxa salina TaxID=215803 RepID=A0A2S9YSI0_9BACT|nr:hypothetical protein [Enhygromyxa salina]PRQ07999.1 hypothetical protein ENSA7_22830 [Enhygromyxa salina]
MNADQPDLDRPWRLPALLALLVFVWLANSSGLLSSNDGSHLALARALVLRGHTQIDPDRALTLEVDLAQRGGHTYSDRPPGTAFAALAGVFIGDQLDPAMFERAMRQAQANRPVEPLPAAGPYIATYAKRSAGARVAGPQLAKLIGTSLAISIHAALVGVVGLLFVAAMLRRFDESLAGLGPRLFALSCLGLGSAWGPYSSALYSHVSAATAVAGFLLGVVVLAADHDRPAAGAARRRAVIGALTGFAGAWAISCDYLLLLAIVPASLLAINFRAWPAVLLGTAPVVVATLAYHHAAFGGVLEVGYDHQQNFEFARERGSTFSGNFFDGIWTLWGLGRGAGLLAQSPIALAGLLAVPLIAWRERGSSDPTARTRVAVIRALAGFSPWIVMLALHRTPFGGNTEDHRYLIPLLPFAALGLGLAWARATPLVRGALAALALASTLLVWRHFLAWHEAPAFDRPALGAAAAALVLAIAAGQAALRRKLRAG